MTQVLDILNKEGEGNGPLSSESNQNKVNNIIALNQQYLQFSRVDSRMIVVKSGKGTGKTKWLADNLKETSLLVISHRVLLTAELAGRLGTAYYKDKGSLIEDRLAICIDSLSNLMFCYQNREVVVIDEATQMLRHFKGETCRSKRQEIYTTLQVVLSQCKQLIILDADMNEETIKFFRGVMGLEDGDITLVENNWNPKDKTFVKYENDKELIKNLREQVKVGKKVFVACDTRSRVKDLAKDLGGVISPNKILSIHGDNSMDAKQKAFMKDVNNQQKLYQVVIVSPSGFTGMDISTPYFEKVYLIGDVGYAIATDLLQASARVRSVKEVEYWISSKRQFEECDAEVIKAELQMFTFGMVPKSILEVMGGEIWSHKWNPFTQEFTVNERPYFDMCCELTALERASLNNLSESFEEKAELEGEVVEYKSTITEEEEREIKEQLKATRAAIKEEENQAVLNAEKLNTLDYLYLKDNENLTREQRLAVKRYKLLDLVEGDEELLKVVVGDEDKYFKAVANWTAINTDTEELEKKDEEDKVKRLAVDWKHRATRQEILKYFLEFIEYDKCLKGKKIEPCTKIIDWAKLYKSEIKQLLGITVQKDVHKKPMQLIQIVLKSLGIEIEAQKKKVSGKTVREYHINQDSADVINKIMDAKRARQEEEELDDNPFA
ncbi:plasmid replication protein, CyRepA1 family [Nostoc sp. PCC 7524]|uniref:plasmid replication protein, CyRepA1 family n=1 Tax=Nostoc sp. (strain ATCC 29411 / PCC 7524) TaxID=28072 RepID=UPI00059FA45E|nr:plasmid replication protein, CyRepA1 family [Nostoc sp. PCC 7524]